MQRPPTGPVRYRREQESGDDRRQVAVQHFMDVPVERRERGRHGHLAEEHRQPDQDPKPGVNGAEEEERSKSVAQQRRPGERLQTRNRGHGFVSLSMPRRAVSQNAAISRRPVPREKPPASPQAPPAQTEPQTLSS